MAYHKILTPRVSTKWAHLHSADRRFAGEGDPGDFSILLLFDPKREDHKKALNAYEAIWTKEYNETCEAEKKQRLHCHDKPWKEDTDKDGNPTGLIAFRVKQKEWRVKDGQKVNQRVAVLDATMDETTVEVGNGSICRASFSMRGFYHGGKFGLTTYLNAIQIIKLERYERDFGFEVEDGWTDDSKPDTHGFENEEPSAEPVAAGDQYLNNGDDELPF